MAVTAWSITQSGRYEPFELQVARNQITNHQIVNISGYNPDVDTSWEDIWPFDGTVNYPAAALQMKVSSSSANDTGVGSGTGARTILITGLDANYNVITETVTLNGQTEVTTTNSFLRINGIIITTAGSNNGAVGDIYIGTGTVTSGVPATIYDGIAVDYNSRLTAAYTIPAGYTGYVGYARITSGQASGTNLITARLRITGTNGIPFTAALSASNNGVADLAPVYPIAVPEKTRVSGMALGAAANNSVGAFFQLLLIKNDAST